MKKIILLLILCLFLSGCKSAINEYDSNMICKMNFQDDLDGSISESESIIYIDYDKDEYVTKAIYQSIGSLSDYNDYLLEQLDYIISMYNKIDGIDAKKYIADEKLILEITYNYKELDIAGFKNEIGDLVDNGSILNNANVFPVKLSEYKKYELEGYDCEVK